MVLAENIIVDWAVYFVQVLLVLLIAILIYRVVKRYRQLLADEKPDPGSDRVNAALLEMLTEPPEAEQKIAETPAGSGAPRPARNELDNYIGAFF